MGIVNWDLGISPLNEDLSTPGLTLDSIAEIFRFLRIVTVDSSMSLRIELIPNMFK